MTSVLVAYATKHGSTQEVAEEIAASLRDARFDVDLRPAGEVAAVGQYDAVVLGAAIYMGRLHPDARRLLRRQRRALAAIPVAVFALGPRTLAEKDVRESRAQVTRDLASVPEVDPFSLAIFGGVVDPRKLHFPLNRMPASDARDWRAIRGWAEEIAFALTAERERVPLEART